MRAGVVCAAVVALGASSLCAAGLAARVEAEEVVFSYTPADNGAGPMWCHGSTCIVRAGEHLFASGIETLAGAKPLNNCLPLLFHRAASGWDLVHKDSGRTREPCPLAASHDGKVFLSINPTLAPVDAYGGPAEPRVVEFDAADPAKKPVSHVPNWGGAPAFSEHSYRSFAADGARGELVLFQNIGYDYAHWAFRDARGNWPATGKLVWPWGAEYDTPQRIRICYPAVALADRAVHFLGVSDIVEPWKKWREYKKKLTGRDWDYDFRRLFYSSCDDIAKGVFRDWVEVASRDTTCGWIFPQDIHIGAGGRVFALWTERAIDERLRKEFFPDAKQRHSLELAVIRDGAVVRRTTLVEGGEGLGNERPGDGRFHVTEDGRLLVFCFVGGADKEGKPLAEHRLIEIGPDGAAGPAVAVKLAQPLPSFFNATVRAGCRPSNVIDVLGEHSGKMRYARVRIE